ncbi:outer membrane beta-barrel protein [Flavihumibacter stibioxidans]|uniref:Outer membrane protein beta-barrel domain-containing protein n=1 Tax=Flavihumibacter stibioxidans TaxID=1834163 RepID=A0ABR7MB56_9BACT|nr:outer membrane beta-barrel protein [Flavihumibacter stibioxidans]MBC6492176.1 hypothetical protein [Flavihumibacter stibioxidans]
MKKFLVLLGGVLMATVSIKAQTEKADWLVGGNFTLNTTTNTTFSLTPAAGYFFLKNFAAGGTFNFLYNKAGDDKTTAFGLGPFARYYFGKNNLKPFAHTEYLFTSVKVEGPGFSSTSNGADFFIGPGLAAFVNEHVAIETLVGYANSNYSGSSNDGGLALRIGFQIYLSPRGIVETYKSN